MRLLLLLVGVFLVGCDVAPAPVTIEKVVAQHDEMPKENGCLTKTSSQLVVQHSVSPIRNLVKDTEEFGNKGLCNVSFEITVNGKDYRLEESQEGLEQLPSLCYYAIERARRNLLLELGGDFKTEAVVTCRRAE